MKRENRYTFIEGMAKRKVIVDYTQAFLYGTQKVVVDYYKIYLYDNKKQERVCKIFRRGLLMSANAKLKKFMAKYNFNFELVEDEYKEVEAYSRFTNRRLW